MFSFNTFHIKSLIWIKPILETDEINSKGTSLILFEIFFLILLICFSSNKSDLEIAISLCLSRSSGLYFFNSFNKTSYCLTISSDSDDKRNNKTEFLSICLKK